MTNIENCPTCDSYTPELHPAVQHEGEVQLCEDPWHATTEAGQAALAAAQKGNGEVRYAGKKLNECLLSGADQQTRRLRANHARPTSR